jgi:protein-tyrosine phosphatase
MNISVLFVCTGNVCRSPMAERLLRARLATRHDGLVVASSAGSRALAGYAMDGASAAVLRDLGGDPDGHVARQLTADMITAADLVLTADSANRSGIVRGAPLAMRKAFTMREFARLCTGLGPLGGEPTVDALRGRIADVAGQRGIAEPGEPGADEIGDPFGAPLPVVQRCGDQVSAAVDGIVACLGL